MFASSADNFAVSGNRWISPSPSGFFYRREMACDAGRKPLETQCLRSQIAETKMSAGFFAVNAGDEKLIVLSAGIVLINGRRCPAGIFMWKLSFLKKLPLGKLLIRPGA